MTAANLQQWIRHPEQLSRDTLYELRTVVARYPYFQAARLLYLKNLYLLHDADFGAELRRAVIYVGDRRVLFLLIEGDNFVERLKRKNEANGSGETAPDITEPSVDRTLALIDAFLATVPSDLHAPTSLDYTVDYTSYLLDTPVEPAADGDDECPKLKGQSLIDDFIEQNADTRRTPKSPVNRETGETPEAGTDEATDVNIGEDDEKETPKESFAEAEADDGYFTETLAHIYIRQRRYSKALEIIRRLSLKYPQKNTYFADQIRFLEKLIINANSK
ncbi:MAG: tetratricopeptide repeat protein [Mediterranea sp.]|jgi:hypothetical protein|nr:tetratricopeptide repeat protein [Mediterranea sp.]